MSSPDMISIQVSGASASGSLSVIEVIHQALRNAYGPHTAILVEQADLIRPETLCPAPDTLFVLKETIIPSWPVIYPPLQT